MIVRVYLVNKTVVCMPIDGRKNMIGQVLPDRETAVLTYEMVAEELDNEGRLDKDSCILN
jgi:hypothetical protein